MLYIVLFGALLCLTVKGYSGKRISTRVKTARDPYLFNFLRMVFCVIIGLLFVFTEGSQKFLSIEPKMVAICALSGISHAMFLVFWMLAIRKNSMVSVDIGLTLGSLIPSILCLILFKEPFSGAKMIGFALILLATFVISSGSSAKTKKSALGMVLLGLTAVGDGLSGFAQQLYKQFYTSEGTRVWDIVYPKTIFHLYTYVFTAFILLSVVIVYSVISMKKSSVPSQVEAQNEPNALKEISSARVIFHIFIMAVCLFASNYLQTVATTDLGMSSQMMYPIIKGGTLATVTVVAMVFFGEKVTKRSISGSLIALLGIVVMSVL